MEDTRLVATHAAPPEPTNPETWIDIESFFATLRRLFSGRIAQVVGELAQNSQRAGAKHVWITTQTDTLGQHWVTYRDDGQGLQGGKAGIVALLRFGASYYTDRSVEYNQQPMGMGFYALLAQSGVHEVIVRSNAVAFEIEPERWWEEKQYREQWLQHYADTESSSIVEYRPGFEVTLRVSSDLLQDLYTVLPTRDPHRSGYIDWDRRHKLGLDELTYPFEGYWAVLERAELNEEALWLGTREEQLAHEHLFCSEYQGNRIYFGPSRYGTSLDLTVNWYGQTIHFRQSSTQLDGRNSIPVSAYLLVTQGQPVTPRAPVREGLVVDEALQALAAWLREECFTRIRDFGPGLPEPEWVRALYELDKTRAKAENPFVLYGTYEPGLSRWPSGYEASEYAKGHNSGTRDEVVRRERVPELTFLDGWVHRVTPSATNDSGIEVDDYEYGLETFLSAVDVAALKIDRDHLPLGLEDPTQTFYWRIPEPIDDLHVIGYGEWAIGPKYLEDQRLLALPWQPLDPGEYFVFTDQDDSDIEVTGFFCAVRATEEVPGFLNEWAGYAYDEDEDGDDDGGEAWAVSIREAIRERYRPNTIHRGWSFGELAGRLPRTAGGLSSVQFFYGNETPGLNPTQQQQYNDPEYRYRAHPEPVRLRLVAGDGTTLDLEVDS